MQVESLSVVVEKQCEERVLLSEALTQSRDQLLAMRSVQTVHSFAENSHTPSATPAPSAAPSTGSTLTNSSAVLPPLEHSSHRSSSQSQVISNLNRSPNMKLLPSIHSTSQSSQEKQTPSPSNKQSQLPDNASSRPERQKLFEKRTHSADRNTVEQPFRLSKPVQNQNQQNPSRSPSIQAPPGQSSQSRESSRANSKEPVPDAELARRRILAAVSRNLSSSWFLWFSFSEVSLLFQFSPRIFIHFWIRKDNKRT